MFSPQKFFPGSQHTSWDSCNKFQSTSTEILICGSMGVLPGHTEASYNIQFFLPNEAPVRIAVFDSRAALVKVLFFALEPATLPGYFRTPPIPWDFTDKNGKRVPAGDYRVYFESEQFLSTSDVAVP
ncbi:MAG: hypothetical protein E6K79_04615 [Candidatus Eisenbacteria bacterium]|uniref:FlgD Ig-like domain-containing protein n=1 Tax=Eiseniibacteriota bacterium TaxID=2212470 RepID=A0A538TPQ6_UNCEI|nr:MAG: hypothetical protein E6K79_04615 [Candidatus Eisenbacteria bacterium]